MDAHRFAWALVACLLLAAVLPRVSAAECGNKSCESGENKCTCPEDCGQCTGTYAGNACQQFTCVSDVCIPILKLGCCGNGICESNEAYASCPDDCFPRSVSVDLVDNIPDKNFLRGEEMIVRVKVLADLTPAANADVKAKSPNFLGSVQLYDDGDHNDLGAKDGVYGSAVTIAPNVAEGDYRVEVEAFVRTVRGQTDFDVRVRPRLDLKADTDADVYALGDIIKVSGSLKRLGAPFAAPVTVEFVKDGAAFFSTVVNPDDEGGFSFERRTSLLDAPGTWLVRLKAGDIANNVGLAEKTIKVMQERGAGFLKTEFVEPDARSYDRTTEVPFVVNVSDPHGDPVEGAKVQVLLPNRQTVDVEELSPGTYAAKYLLPVDFPVGQESFEVRALKDINSVQYSGSASKDLVINRVPLTVDVKSPAKGTYNLGEPIEFRVRAFYAFNKPVDKSTILLDFGNHITGAKLGPDGYYHYSMTVTNKAVKVVEAKVKVTDPYGNVGASDIVLQILPEYSLAYTLSQKPLQYGAMAGAALLALVFVGYLGWGSVKLRTEEKRRKALTESKKKIQEQYFNERLIDNHEYLQLTEKLNAELDQVEARLSALRQANPVERIRQLLPRKKD